MLKTVITYICDGCGKSEQIDQGQEPPMLEFIVKASRKPAKKTEKTTSIHFHTETCLPPWALPLLAGDNVSIGRAKDGDSHQSMLQVVTGSQPKRPVGRSRKVKATK